MKFLTDRALRRLLAATACLGLTSIATAAPYLVQFEGAITEIDEGAPDTFWIGERVSGAFAYDIDVEPTLYLRATSPRDPSDAIVQVWQGSHLALATESGFVAYDATVDLRWFGSSAPQPMGVGFSNTLDASNGGRWINTELQRPEVPNTLVNRSGPIASEIGIRLVASAASFFMNDLGLPEATLGSVANPMTLKPVSGSIAFGLPGDSSATDVTFDIDQFTIIAIPEPATILLLSVAIGYRPSRTRR